MRCRKNKLNEKRNYNVVWFNSLGTKLEQHMYFEYFTEPEPLYPNGKSYKTQMYTLGPSKEKIEYYIYDEQGEPTQNNYVCITKTGIEINYDDDGFFAYQGEIFFSHYIVEKDDLHMTLTLRDTHEESNYRVCFIFHFFNETISASNDKSDYASHQEGVKDSLIQRLSVLKNELWYRSSYGLPLFDKIRNKAIIDSVVIDIITSHPDVTNLVNFSSTMDKHSYNLNFSAATIYTDEIISINMTFN